MEKRELLGGTEEKSNRREKYFLDKGSLICPPGISMVFSYLAEGAAGRNRKEKFSLTRGHRFALQENQ